MTVIASSQAAPASSSRAAAAAASRGAGAAACAHAVVSCACAAYRSLTRSSHAAVQYPQLGGVRVAGPHEVPADVRPAVKIDQSAGFLPGGLVNGVEVAGDHQPPRPPVIVIRGELPGLLVDARMPGQDGP